MRRIILFSLLSTLYFVQLPTSNAQTTRLVGVGTHHGGTIFSLDENGDDPERLMNFSVPLPDRFQNGRLVEHNGKIWGTTASGGEISVGVIFSMNQGGSEFQIIHSFDVTHGAHPFGGLVLSNGKLWGMSKEGGSFDLGVIYSINTDGSGFEVAHHFDGATGQNPEYELLESNGKLWGTTPSGGANDDGVVFSLNTDGTGFSVVHEFHYDIDGAMPYCTLIESNGKIWGSTSQGGNGGVIWRGNIFNMNTDGTGFTEVYAFNSGLIGSGSGGTLLESGGRLWGLTRYFEGGLFREIGGNCYPVCVDPGTDPDGDGWGWENEASCVVLYSDAYHSGTSCADPPNTGDTNGTIFSIGNDGTGMKLHYAFPSTAEWTQGGSLTEFDGKFLGMKSGLLYSLELDGSGFTEIIELEASSQLNSGAPFLEAGGKLWNTNVENIFTFDYTIPEVEVVHSFDAPNGLNPAGHLLEYEERLWGLTRDGGTHNGGVIFSITFDGSDYTIHHHFEEATGINPLFEGYLTLSDGKFWGMTRNGGANDQGVIFTLGVDGNGYSKIYDFTSQANGTQGLLAYNDKLWGISDAAGAHGRGYLFRVDQGSTVSTVYDFENIYPAGALLESEGRLWGVGATDVLVNGIIYSVMPDGTDLTIHHEFDGPNGQNPFGQLLESNGKFWGVTRPWGNESKNVVFMVDKDGTSNYTVVREFSATTVSGSLGHRLIEHHDRIWGVTSTDSEGDIGHVFSFDINGADYQAEYVFSPDIGGSPIGSLTKVTTVAPTPTAFEIDSLALVALYNTTDGDHWTNNTNWLTGTVDSWYGVTVDADRVTRVYLDGNNLSGAIPGEIGDLDALTELNLSFNNGLWESGIPAEIWTLTSLRLLSLTDLLLGGNLPPEVGNLTQLERLYLRSNNLSGTVPEEVWTLTNLVGLALEYNQFTGELPAEIGNLTQLDHLYLGASNFSGPIPSQLGNLTNLRELFLNDNDFSGQVPSELGNLISLEQLKLQNNDLEGTIPESLINLSGLAHLDISNNAGLCEPTSDPYLVLVSSLETYANSLTCQNVGSETGYRLVKLSDMSFSDFAPSDATIVDDRVYVISNIGGNDKMKVVDISNPSNPMIVSEMDFEFDIDASSILADNNRLYIGGDGSGDDATLAILDISNPDTPSLLGHFLTIPRADQQEAREVTDLKAVKNDILYAQSSTFNFMSIDVSDPIQPIIVDGFGDDFTGLIFGGIGPFKIVDETNSWLDNNDFRHVTIDNNGNMEVDGKQGVQGELYDFEVLSNGAMGYAATWQASAANVVTLDFSNNIISELNVIDVDDSIGGFGFSTEIEVYESKDLLFVQSVTSFLMLDITNRLNPQPIRSYDGEDFLRREGDILVVDGGFSNDLIIYGIIEKGHKSEQILSIELASKTYGDGPFTLSVESNTQNQVSFESSNPEVISVVGDQATIEGVGTAIITATQEEDEAYSKGVVSGEIRVFKKVLRASADDKTRTYGGVNPELTIAYSGFVNGESSADITAPDISTEATQFSVIGSYPINLTGGSAINYNISTSDGALTIEKAALTVTADNHTITSIDPIPELTMTYDGFVLDDDPSDITPPTISTNAVSGSPGGTYDILLSGGTADNYDLILINGILTIEAILGVSNEVELGVSMYPNPVTTSFRITKLPVLDEILIYDLAGNLVKQFRRTEPEYNIESLAPGVYTVLLKGADNVHLKRIIKK